MGGMPVRALALAILAVIALAGCLDPLLERALMVVVTSDLAITGAGKVDEFAAFRCPMVKGYQTQPPAVTLIRPPWRPEEHMHVDFVMVYDPGEAWRPWVANGSDLDALLALTTASGGTPIPLRWPGGSGSFGTGPPFPHADAYTYTVGWRDGRAWVDDEALPLREPIARSYHYRVEEANASLDVRETLTFTYVGKAHVSLVEPADGCDPFAGGSELTRSAR